jgi:hypothetical protein
LQLYSFPLQVGGKWTTTSVVSGNPSKDLQTANGEVVGWEDVVTPSGKFHALKIEVYLSATKNGQQVSQTLETTWYAPEVKHAVRTSQSVWQAQRQTWVETQRLELADYQAGGA